MESWITTTFPDHDCLPVCRDPIHIIRCVHPRKQGDSLNDIARTLRNRCTPPLRITGEPIAVEADASDCVNMARVDGFVSVPDDLETWLLPVRPIEEDDV